MPPSVSLRKLSTQVCDTGNRQKPVRALDSISESNSRQAISRHNRVREKATATARGSGAWRSDFNANGVQQLDEHFVGRVARCFTTAVRQEVSRVAPILADDHKFRFN